MTPTGSPLAARADSISRVVEVFPRVPVIPSRLSSRAGYRKNAAARSGAATRGSGTTIVGRPAIAEAPQAATAPALARVGHEASAVVASTALHHEQVAGPEVTGVDRDSAHLHVGADQLGIEGVSQLGGGHRHDGICRHPVVGGVTTGTESPA